MRAYFVLALLAVASAATFKNNRAFEDTIKDFLECLRGEMEVGWPDFGLPHLNPLEITDLTLTLDNLAIEGIRGELNVQDLVLSGLTGFEYDNVKGSIGLLPPSYTAELDLNFPNVVLDTKYSGAVAIDQIEIDTFGTGTLSLEANNLKASIGLKATILGGLGLEYLDVWVSVDPLVAFKITGIRDDEDFSAQLSEDLLAHGHEELEQLAPVLHDMVETIAMDLINNGDLGDEGGFLSGLIDRCLSI